MKYQNKIIKNNYAFKILESTNNLDKTLSILNKKDYAPLLTPTELHAESEVTKEQINDYFQDIGMDIDIVSNDTAIATERFKNLIETTRAKLNDTKNILKAERDRLEDINVLCNKYTDFYNTIDICKKNIAANAIVSDDNLISLSLDSDKKIYGEIISITGNGYEGNANVYKDGAFVSESTDTSNHSYILDDSNLTYYEYSRLTVSNAEKNILSLVNYDSIMARCCITIKASEEINLLELKTENEDLILESLSTSNDNITYTTSEIKNVSIKNKSNRFDSFNYVYGSGILSFRNCQYVKLVLRASKNTNDVIAGINANSNVDIYETARRSVIKINNIILSNKVYKSKGQIVIDNIITNPVNSIAIFANEYCSDDLNIRNSIKYTLTVNGIGYEIIPINYPEIAKKIIKTTNTTTESIDSVHYINENIKNASLTINMESNKNYTTPFISNVRVLIGG